MSGYPNLWSGSLPKTQTHGGKEGRSPAYVVEFLLQPAEDPLPLAAGSIGTVVLTWTLCSIADPQAALGEMKRVPKNDGHLMFVKHGRAPDDTVVAWQDRLTPLWKRAGGGCYLNRKIDALIEGLRPGTLNRLCGN